MNNNINLIINKCLHINIPLHRLYPEITSDEQRQQYKKEFDSDLARYKSLCAEMDGISDQMHNLSRELDTLDEGSMKYEVQKNKREAEGFIDIAVSPN